MSTSNFKKKSIYDDTLNIIHKNVIKVALKLRKKQRIFEMETLLENCLRELPNPPHEIITAIDDLYNMKYILPGKQLFKSDILQNEKRYNLFTTISKNPGIHERELRKLLKLGAYESNIHLTYLIRFGFIRKINYKNRTLFFQIDFDENSELETILLRNETTRAIYDCISFSEKIRLSQITDILQIPHSTIHKHIGELLEAKLIEKIQEDNITYYVIRKKLDKEKIPFSDEKIEIRREFDYVGGQIRFKVAIRNFTDMTINNVIVTLNPSDQFIIDQQQQKVPNFPPNTTKGIDFYLTPLTCGQSKVYGTFSYEDAYGKIHSKTIEPKEISIKCPLVKPQPATQTEVNEWIKNLKKGSTEINYKEGISEQYAFQIGQEQVNALDLNEITTDSEELWGLYSGQVKVTGKEMVVKLSVLKPNIILDVWAEDLKQTTGFIAYLTNLINIALDIAHKSIRKTKDLLEKISNLIKISAFTHEIFQSCKDLSKISKITKSLSMIQQLIHETIPDSSLVQPLQVWSVKLTSMFDSNQEIDESVAIDLQYETLEWLYKIQEHIKSYRKIYQETFDDLNHASEDISRGIHLLDDKIRQDEEEYGLNILSYLLVIDRKSGICLFEKSFGDIAINPDLISGFLHALQSFGLEIAASENSMKTITYQKYKFQIESGNLIHAALITRGTPNEYLTSHLSSFVKVFELTFKESIFNYTGNSAPFQKANELFDSIFK